MTPKVEKKIGGRKCTEKNCQKGKVKSCSVEQDRKHTKRILIHQTM